MQIFRTRFNIEKYLTQFEIIPIQIDTFNHPIHSNLNPNHPTHAMNQENTTKEEKITPLSSPGPAHLLAYFFSRVPSFESLLTACHYKRWS